jgi:hypothetical protein
VAQSLTALHVLTDRPRHRTPCYRAPRSAVGPGSLARAVASAATLAITRGPAYRLGAFGHPAIGSRGPAVRSASQTGLAGGDTVGRHVALGRQRIQVSGTVRPDLCDRTVA